jgi:class 3 adenylate cyclase/DNA-binding CsgD family transcriptional regulator/tetratricopeptide (TPR) repeat protein
MDRPFKLVREGRPENLMRTVPAFVGRREELAGIERCLQDAVAGHPRVVLIPGEAGIGKTRLLHEVRSIALHRGLQVCYGRCYEDLALPYLPFVEILRPHLEQLPKDMQQVLGADAEILGQLLHRAGRPLSTAELSTSAQTEQDKLQLFLAASHTIISLAQSRPMLFVMDDLHWADPPSLDLFGHLGFTVADTAMRESVPLLLLGTYRPLEPEARLARLIARFQREAICQTLILAGLNESETQALVQGLGLVRPSHQLIATISEATQGNPLFIQEVFHHLVQQDALQERGGYVVTTASASDLQLPKHVTGAIAARIEGLSAGCRQLLTLASCLGEHFSLQVLGALSRLSEEELLVLLEEGMHQRLLLSEGQAFQFVHPLIRHVFYHAPSVARRQRMHQQIAQTLENLYVDSLDEHTIEIVHHLIRAGHAAAVEKVVQYARRAGDRAFTVFAWGEAARYYEAALSAAETTGYLSAHDRAELHYQVGLAHYYDQDVGPCLDHYEKAIEAYRQTDDLRGLAQALMEKTRTHLTLAAVPLGSLADIQPLEDVLEALGDGEPRLRGQIVAIISEAYRHGRQAAKANERAQQALEIGQRLQDDPLCAYACFALGLSEINGLHVREALESWQNALVYARRTDDLIRQGWALHRIPLALTLLGRLDEAEAVALEACELTRKTQDWGNYSLGLSHLASVAAARGDFDTTERRAHETMVMVSRSRYPWGGFRSLLALACARVLRGTWSEAEDALELLVEPGRVFEEPGPVVKAFAQIFRQLLRAYAGIVDGALEPLVADLMQVVGTDTYSLAPLCALVELSALGSASTSVALPYQALLRAAERGVLFSSGWMFLLPRVFGVAASVDKRWDEAERRLQAAIDMAAGVQARPELGRAYLDYARMLAARGKRGDRGRATELVQQAGVIFHELSMEPFVRQAAQVAKALKARMSPPSRLRPSPHNLSAREVEILLQIAQGRTEQEVAAALMLTPQTVARHISSLFTKIGVNNRDAAAAYVSEQGLTSQVQPPRRTETRSEPDSVSDAGEAQLPQIILVTDMAGSTAIIHRLGDVQAHELLRIHNTVIRDCLGEHRGTEILHTGDGVEASFRTASSAIACAVAIQKALDKHNQEHLDNPIHVRIGINAGEPIATEGRLFGTAIHMAFRICTRAQPDQILVSDVVRQLAAGKGFTFVNRGRVGLKGFPGRVRLYEVPWGGDHR